MLVKIGILKDLVLLAETGPVKFEETVGGGNVTIMIAEEGGYEYRAGADQLVLLGLLEEPKRLFKPDRMVYKFTPAGVEARKELLSVGQADERDAAIKLAAEVGK